MSTLAPSALACGGVYSECFNADSLWIDPFPGEGLAVSSPWQRPRGLEVGLSSSFQKRPLTAVLASPDPFGTMVTVLDNWWTTQLFAAVPLGRFDVGFVLPASLHSSGTGVAALSSRAGSSSQTGIGDPRLSLRLTRRLGLWSLGVTQELSLPVGAAHSLLTSESLSYSPRLTLGRNWAQWWAVAEIGARLRKSTPFGPLHFGSEATLAVAGGVHLTPGLSAFLESWATPSLSLDEVRHETGSRTLRRIPSEVLAGLAGSVSNTTAKLALGTSLPLSREQLLTPGEPTVQVGFAGPPAPRLRLQFQVDTSW